MGLQRRPARPRACRAQGVGGGHEDRFDARRLLALVMAGYSIENRLGLAVPAGEIEAYLDVAPLGLVVDGLADVVEQARTPGHCCIYAKLGGHHPAQVRHLFDVLEAVLAVRAPVLEPAHELDDFGMEPFDPKLESRRFAFLLNELIHFLLDLGDHLLNTARVDAAVFDEPLQGDTGDLAFNGIES